MGDEPGVMDFTGTSSPGSYGYGTKEREARPFFRDTLRLMDANDGVLGRLEERLYENRLPLSAGLMLLSGVADTLLTAGNINRHGTGMEGNPFVRMFIGNLDYPISDLWLPKALAYCVAVYAAKRINDDGFGINIGGKRYDVGGEYLTSFGAAWWGLGAAINNLL